MLTKKLVIAIAVVVAYAGSLNALPTGNEDPTGVFIPDDTTARANLDREMSGPGDVPSVIDSHVDRFRRKNFVDEADTTERFVSGTSDRRKMSNIRGEEPPSPMEAVSDQPTTGMKARELKSGQDDESDVIPGGATTIKDEESSRQGISEDGDVIPGGATTTNEKERSRAFLEEFPPSLVPGFKSEKIDSDWKPSARRSATDDLE